MFTSFQLILLICCTLVQIHNSHQKGVAKKVMACEGSSATLTCPSGNMVTVHSALYGREVNENDLCPGRIGATGCSSKKTLNVIKKLCQGEMTCAVRSSSAMYGDPCGGTKKYLKVEYSCISAGKALESCRPNPCENGGKCHMDKKRTTVKCACPERYTGVRCEKVKPGADARLAKKQTPTARPRMAKGKSRVVTVCEGKTAHLSCGKGDIISLLSAMYGRGQDDHETCPGGTIHFTGCHSRKAMKVTKEKCQNKKECRIKADSRTFGDPCRKTKQYFTAQYNCVSSVKSAKKSNKLVTLRTSRKVTKAPTNKYRFTEKHLRKRLKTTKRPKAEKAMFTKRHSRKQLEATARTKVKSERPKVKGERVIKTNSRKRLKATSQPKLPTSGKESSRKSKTKKIVSPSKENLGNSEVGGVKGKDLEAVACERKSVHLMCATGHVIRLQSAMFGRAQDDEKLCPGRIRHTGCYSRKAMKVTEEKCQGKRQCQIKAESKMFGDPCQGTKKVF